MERAKVNKRTIYGAGGSSKNNEGETDLIEIGIGTKQGCPLSPVLFNLYDEAMIREAFYDLEEGIIIREKLIKEIRFADDKRILATTNTTTTATTTTTIILL